MITRTRDKYQRAIAFSTALTQGRQLSSPFLLFACLPAVTLLLLPFLGLGFFLLRRNFQRGGISQVIAASMARKMAERSMRGGVPGTGVGGSSGGGGIGNVGPMGQWMQRAPTQGILSSVLSSMLGGGIRGMELLGVLQRCA